MCISCSEHADCKTMVSNMMDISSLQRLVRPVLWPPVWAVDRPLAALL